MRRSILPASLVLLVALVVPTPAHATEPLLPVSLPILGSELPIGTGTAVATTKIPKAATRTVDGGVSDWVGQGAGYGGTAIYSAGEYVYQDHLYDSFGADNGEDVKRNQRLDALAAVVPETYRAEAAFRYLAGELGAPAPLAAETNYGNLGPLFTADLEEVRVAVTSGTVWFLARTTNLTAADQTAVLVLADTVPGSGPHDVGFNSGLTTTRADVAILLAGSQGWTRDLASGAITALPAGSVATDPSGFTNAIEARIPGAALKLAPGATTLPVAVGAGPFNASASALANVGGDLPSNIANVAFRFAEPVREWFEKQQAFALYAKTMDPFFATVSLNDLHLGTTQRYVPGPGYHDRIFVSSASISRENSRDGIWQDYGLYLPTGYQPGERLPLQFWLHWRGGTAHSAGAATPRIFRDMGDRVHTIVVSPRGRGTSSWYVGIGQADVLEVYDDVTHAFPIQLNRVYLAGHSMGGWGSFLFSILYPDRFAAALPASPPVTQGAWTGLDFAGCDDFQFQEYTPCYIQANDGRARDEHDLRMLDNLRSVPLAIYQGLPDELVPYPGVLRNVLRLQQLGYRFRFYTFPTQEHYGPPVWDQWKDGAKYLHQFALEQNPSQVTYIRDMPFERAIEELNTLGTPMTFDFNHAFWMSELTPADLQAGAARFDGTTLAKPIHPYLVVPEVGGPAGVGQTGPYLMLGQRWLEDPTKIAPPPQNGFVATLTGASAVRLNLARMVIDVTHPVTGTVTTDHALQLRLTGSWAGTVTVRVGATVLPSSYSAGVLTISLPAGTTAFTVTSA